MTVNNTSTLNIVWSRLNVGGDFFERFQTVLKTMELR